MRNSEARAAIAAAKRIYRILPVRLGEVQTQARAARLIEAESAEKAISIFAAAYSKSRGWITGATLYLETGGAYRAVEKVL